MKFTILHESSGRIRVQLAMQRMTTEQADYLETCLLTSPCICQATVHERTCCVILLYRGSRASVLKLLSSFSFRQAAGSLTGSHSSRALNREFEGKLVRKIGWWAVRKLYFPAPLQIAYTLLHSIPHLYRAVRSVLQGHIHVELLDGLSIGISMLRGDFSTAGSVMLLLEIGGLLEDWTHRRSVEDLARSMSLNIDRVWKTTPDGEVLVPLTQVSAGDRISVHMGSMIPLDGTVETGEIMVNQSSLTGESLPVEKRPGTTVYAGTVVEEGDCTILVDQQSGSSRYDKIVEMIEASEKLKSSVETRASSLADKLVPWTLAVSGLTWLLTKNTTRAASVLMVDFSCALKLSMPLSVLSAMREASHYHTTVKGGRYLEAAAAADMIVFDKTGTLTRACPTVARVIPFGGREEKEMLRLSACLEEHFPHSMANAVVQAAKNCSLAHEEMHSEVEYIVAHGIASRVGNQRVIIGSYHFVFEDEKCTIPPEDLALFDSLPDEYSHLYLAIGGELAAVICIEDPLRPEARSVIQALRELGIRSTVMLTGDSERTAAAIAAQVGVDTYRAEVLPGDKAQFIQDARAQGHTVIMTGDGINDSPALSAADVGIAVSDGAAIAREIADITISTDDLRTLVTLRRLSMALMQRIHSNYRFVVGFNGTLILLGALGILQPAASALLHNVSTICLSLHSMTGLLDRSPQDPVDPAEI